MLFVMCFDDGSNEAVLVSNWVWFWEHFIRSSEDTKACLGFLYREGKT